MNKTFLSALLATLLLIPAMSAAAAPAVAPPAQEASVLAACRAWMAPLAVEAEFSVKAVDGGLCLNGMTDRGADRIFLDAFRHLDPSRPQVIVIRSGGGDAATTLTMAEAIQPRSITVIGDALCASACADYVLPAGKRRVVEPQTLLLYHGGVMLDAINEAADQLEAQAKAGQHIDLARTIDLDRRQINAQIARQEALLAKEGISPSLFRWMDLINHMSPEEQATHCPAGSDIIAYPPDVLARFGLTFDLYGGPRSQGEADAIVARDRRTAHICYWKE
ncbi:MAG: hypothetical protein ACXU8O_06435 [Asticcacaulis sp.]